MEEINKNYNIEDCDVKVKAPAAPIYIQKGRTWIYGY
jgi:hypothetical protein